MADAPAILSAHVISELRKLEGRAKVTHPYGVKTHPRIERVVKVAISNWEIAYGTPDEEYAECLLKQQEKVAEDNHYAHVYRRYEKLPGPVVSSAYLNERGDTVTRVEQAVAAGTAAGAETFLQTSASVAASSALEAQRVTETVDGFTPLVTRQVWGTDGASGDVILLKTTETEVAPDAAISSTERGLLSDTVQQHRKGRATRIKKEYVKPDGGAVASNPEEDTARIDQRTGATITTTRKVVPASTALPVKGSAYRTGYDRTGYVAESRLLPIEGSANKLLEVDWVTIPPPRVEFIDIGFRFPAIFTYGSWTLSANYPGTPPPWPGDGVTPGTYKLVAGRQLTRPARFTYSYRKGHAASCRENFSVNTPGVSSKLFSMIPSECIHPPIQVFEIVSHATNPFSSYTVNVKVEDIPASTPSQYDPRDVLVAKSSAREWMADIYEYLVVEVSESTDPNEFPAPSVGFAFQAVSQRAIESQPKTAETFYLRSSNSVDAGRLRLYGRKKSKIQKEFVTLTGANPVSTINKYDHFFSIQVSGTAPIGNVTMFSAGSPASATARVKNIPIEGNTLTVGRSGSPIIYTWRASLDSSSSPSPFDLLIPSSISDVVATIANAIEAQSFAGAQYHLGTTAHPHIRANVSPDGSDDEIEFYDHLRYYNTETTWKLEISGTWMEISQSWENGEDGPTVATLPLGETDVYKDINFNNSPLMYRVPELANNNLPPGINVVSDPISIPTKPCFLTYCVTGSPALPCSYQVSYDGGTTWVSGSRPLKKAGGGAIYTVVTEPVSMIRFLINSSAAGSARKAHAVISYQV